VNRITQHNLEPGTYIDDQGFEVVLLDIVDHAWNMDKQLLEFLPSALVVCRDLMMKDDKRYQWPIEVFKSKFKRR